MIRINTLLRTAKLLNKIPVRAGPGWDRPDVPPTARVQRDTRFTHEEIIYTFFDSSMPEFFLTEPQIYEGDAFEALPTFGKTWALVLGTAFSIWAFQQLVNHERRNKVVEPVTTAYFLNQFRRVTEEKIAYKYAKQNPFGISIHAELFPNENYGKYFYPKGYYKVKASAQKTQTIQNQANEYLKGAILRAKTVKKSHEAHH